MKRLLCLLAVAPLLACNQPQPAASSNSSSNSAAKIAELENRINTLETMIRALDRRDDRIADMATQTASTRPASSQSPGISNRADQRISALDSDIANLNRQLATITEQLGAVAEGMAELNDGLQEVQTTLGNHEQVLERLISGN